MAKAVVVRERLEIFGGRPCRQEERAWRIWLDSSSCSLSAGPGHIHTRGADGGHWALERT